MTSTAFTTAASPDDHYDLAAQLSAHVATIRALLAAGLLTPAALGLAPAEPPGWQARDGSR